MARRRDKLSRPTLGGTKRPLRIATFIAKCLKDIEDAILHLDPRVHITKLLGVRNTHCGPKVGIHEEIVVRSIDCDLVGGLRG